MLVPLKSQGLIVHRENFLVRRVKSRWNRCLAENLQGARTGKILAGKI